MADENWYYAQNNQQLGPVTLDALRGMVASGQVGQPTWSGRRAWPSGCRRARCPEVAQRVARRRRQREGGGGASRDVPARHRATRRLRPPHRAPARIRRTVTTAAALRTVDHSGKATTAMGLGIASLPLCLCPFVGIGLGIAAIVVGNGVHEGPDKGQGKDGRDLRNHRSWSSGSSTRSPAS